MYSRTSSNKILGRHGAVGYSAPDSLSVDVCQA